MDFDDSEGSRILRDELACYPTASSDSSPDLVVEHLPMEDVASTLHNPSVHVEDEDGFTAHYTTASVRYVFEGERLKRVRFYENTSRHAVMRTVRRIADVQFTSRVQRTGIIFHELALIPAIYFMPDRTLVHASALQSEDDGVVLIGGTGGVGKTSLELHLALNGSFGFVADDICVMDQDGWVWPNLAYPKIYAYNLEDNVPLRDRVLGSRGGFDRLHWIVRARLGASKVRRRISPVDLFSRISTEGGPLRSYTILSRESREEIRTELIAAERAAHMSTAVLATEFFQFNNHLNWHYFNRAVRGEKPVATLDEVTERWRTAIEGALDGVECRLIRIPTSMKHADFKSKVADLLSHAVPQ